MTATMPRGAFAPDPHTIYLGDNGRALCGAHLGVTARTTGRDLSGQAVHPVMPAEALAAVRDPDIGYYICCEQCGRRAALPADVCRYCGPDCSSLTHPPTDRVATVVPRVMVAGFFDPAGLFDWEEWRGWAYGPDDMPLSRPDGKHLYRVGIFGPRCFLYDQLVWAHASDDAVMAVYNRLALDDMTGIEYMDAEPVPALPIMPPLLTLPLMEA